MFEKGVSKEFTFKVYCALNFFFSCNIFFSETLVHNNSSSLIRQKGESQNGRFKKTRHVKFLEKRTFLTPWYDVCVSEGEKCLLLGKFGVLCFLNTSFLWFTLLPYYRDLKIKENSCQCLYQYQGLLLDQLGNYTFCTFDIVLGDLFTID